MCVLLTGVSGAWAADGYITVKIADGTTSNGPATYGDANSGKVNGSPAVTFKSTWTSVALSGKAGLTLSVKTSADEATNALAEETAYDKFHCLGFKPSAGNATDILTITAPSGYIITGYYIEAGYWTGTENYTLTAGAGTGTTSYTTSAAPKNGTKGLEVSGINATSTTISIKSNQADNERCLMMNKFTVTIFPKELYDAEASIKSGGLYRIFTKNNGTAEGDTKYYLTTSGTSATLTTNLAEAAEFSFYAITTDAYVPAGYAWKISNGGYRFTNRPYQAPGQDHLNRTNTNDRDDYEAQVFYLNGGKYAVRSTNFDGSGSNYVQNSYWNVVAGSGVPNATYDDTEGTKHYIWQLEEIETTVTFNLIYNDETIATTGPLNNSSGTYNGTATLPIDTWNNPYCSYSYSPTTITSETRTVNVTMTWEGPFPISSDYASATWSYLKLNSKYAKYDKDRTINGSTGYMLYSNLDDVRYTDEGLWAFVGNPFKGVRVFNKAAGSDKCIQWTTQPKMEGTNKGNAVFWQIGKLAGSGFLLYYGGFYLTDLSGSGQLKISNASGMSTDTKSAFTITNLDWRDKTVFAVQDYAKTHKKGVYFGTDETLYNSTINSIKTYPSFTEEMYNGTITSLNNGELLKYPATGNYLIKHVESNYYLGTDGTKTILQSSIAPSNIALLEKGSGNSYNILVQGKYIIPQAPGNFIFIGDSPSSALSGKMVENTNYSEFWVGSSYCILAQTYANDGHPISWDSSRGTSTQWDIEDADNKSFTVPLTNIDDYSYATLYLPFGATITGAKAYILTVSGEWAIPHEISEVPANTGVLLRAEGDVDEVTVTVKSAATADTEGNMLAGTNIDITADRSAGEYILGNGSEGLGFYQRKSGRKIGANKAYLQLGADLAVKGLLLRFDEETGISTVQGSGLMVNGSEIFNLAGQRMSRVQKGVNIVNGKKVLVK